MFDKFFKSSAKTPPSPQAPQPVGETTITRVVEGAASSGLVLPSRPAVESVELQPFITREPVLNRAQRIVGYEFSLHHTLKTRLAQEDESARRRYDEALLRNLVALDLGELLGRRIAFIELSAASLDNPAILDLPRENLVIAIYRPAVSAVTDDALVARMRLLRGGGFSLAFAAFGDTPPVPGSLDLVHYVAVNTANHDGSYLDTLVGLLRRGESGDTPRLKLMAKNLESYDDFNLCYRIQFDLFQGPFVSAKEPWTAPKADASQMHIIELLNKVRSDAEIDDLAKIVKHDPTLSYKLLRYINSPAIGLMTKTASIDHALVVLGRDKFYRWLTLLLFTVKSPSSREWMLIENSLVRGRLMELVGREKLPRKEQDNLFLTGIFSLLDELMQMPFELILHELKLPENVRDAIVDRAGPYAALLRLAEACEASDIERMRAEAAAMGIDAEMVNRCSLEALTWAHEATQDPERER